MKRAIDIVVAAAAMIVMAPVLALAMLAIRLSAGPGPLLVRSSFVGASGKDFSLLTLRVDGHARENDFGRDGHGFDWRVAPIIRAYRLDQIPVLVNVLRGDMSLVGPRLVQAQDVDWHDPIQRAVFTRRPGLTGLAQLAHPPAGVTSMTMGTASATAGAHLRLDSYYIDHQSLWLDLRILVRAVLATVRSAANWANAHLVAPSTTSSIASSAATSIAVALARLRGRHLFFIDVAASAIAIYLVFALRSTAGFAGGLVAQYLPAVLLPILIRPLINIGVGLYQRLWHHASVPELLILVKAVAAGSVVSMAGFYLILATLNVPGTDGFPRSFWVLEALLTLTMVAASRLAIRATASLERGVRHDLPPTRFRTLLYGAGTVGSMIARSAANERHAGVHPVGFLDDDRSQWGQRVAGLPVYGGVDAMGDAATLTAAQVLLITMPTARGTALRRVTEAGLAAGLEVRTVPPIHELFDGSVDAFRIRRVRIEDLIRRSEVAHFGPDVEAIIRDRAVLVTGAGGSIGSELARQIFAMEPRRLILVDRGESALYSIQRELETLRSIGRDRGRGNTEIVVKLANVASRDLMQRIVEAARPDVILHAAANKHVPLMESHPSEAVQVNVGGTMAVLDAAIVAGTPTFVLVSTDKAVAPTSTMGATKRLAEWLVADAARLTGRAYVSVRFGNVLGSTGSVIPIFQGQLEQGQPLTITHPEMTRYFMTIPEASSLILQAAAIGGPGDLFVLDMGEPLRILDLARDFLRLAGRDPDTVPVIFTGLRPGEKMHEQLFYDHETPRPTANPKVMLAKGDVVPDTIRRLALELLSLADSGREDVLRARLFDIVASAAPPTTISLPPSDPGDSTPRSDRVAVHSSETRP